jgi:putative toxin-antitoxin system antitoxin component (TIGR02293 family)
MTFKHEPGQSIPGNIWEAIGLPSCGTRLYELIHQGLPFELLDQAASLLQIRRVDISNALRMSPAELARRAETGRFNTAESDCLVGFIAVFEQALSLFENDTVAVTKWMCSPVRGLGQKRPLDMLGTRVEANAVLDLIGRLERGVLT